MPIAFGLIALLIIGTTTVAILYWNIFFETMIKTKFWWVATLPVFAVGFWIILFGCLLKGDADKKTKNRNIAVHEVCKGINRQYLSKSDVKVAAGDYSAWLEINYDPKKGELKLIQIKFNSI